MAYGCAWHSEPGTRGVGLPETRPRHVQQVLLWTQAVLLWMQEGLWTSRSR